MSVEMNDTRSWPRLTEGAGDRIRQQLIALRGRGMDKPKVSDLKELCVLAEKLVPDAALKRDPAEGARFWPENSDPGVRRVEVLLECAIDGYVNPHDPFYDPALAGVARIWFGLDRATRKMDQAERHQEATRALDRGIETSTFKVHYARKIKEALSARLTSRYRNQQPFTLSEATSGPLSDPSVRAEGPIPVPRSKCQQASPSSRLSRRLTPIILGLLITGMLIIAAIILVDLTSSSPSSRARHPSKAIPPKGAVINATTGEASKPDLTAWTNEVKLVGGGPMFRACNFTDEPQCEFRGGRFQAEIGDRFRFAIILENLAQEPLPYARFSVNFENLNLEAGEWHANLFVAWPRKGDERQPMNRKGRIAIASNGDPIAIHYIPGSTELLPLNPQHRITYLPDGVTSLSGVGLTNIGPPNGCIINCVGRYIRFIEFEAKIARYAREAFTG